MQVFSLGLWVFVLSPLFVGDTDPVIGQQAPAWSVRDWMNSPPIEQADLEGNVVLIRWWTAPGCPYCSASASALDTWNQAYKDQGLVVLGFYHHKARTPITQAKVKGYADQLGFDFPIAIDYQWETLERWWLSKTPDARWTSISFLVDRKGVVQYVHPGGKYEKGDGTYEALQAKIEALLDE